MKLLSLKKYGSLSFIPPQKELTVSKNGSHLSTVKWFGKKGRSILSLLMKSLSKELILVIGRSYGVNILKGDIGYIILGSQLRRKHIPSSNLLQLKVYDFNEIKFKKINTIKINQNYKCIS